MLDELEKNRFLCARSGDDTINIFQCECCHFQNIKKRNPILGTFDEKLLGYTKRAILDSFWSRESSTVRASLGELKRDIGFGHELDMTVEEAGYPPRGPFPINDNMGMGQAIIMLRRSQEPGRYDTFVQFNTARKHRSAFGNYWHTTPQVLTTSIFSSEGRKTMATDCPVYGHWYTRFMQGVHNRMGDDIRPDMAVSIELLLEMLKRLDKSWEASKLWKEKMEVAELGFFLAAGYSAALRGEEIVKMDMREILLRWEDALGGDIPFIPLPLLGRFKGETGHRHHIIPIAAVTESKIRNDIWCTRLVQVKTQMNITRGWVFAHKDGKRKKASDYEEGMMLLLENIQATNNLIPLDVDVREEYGVYRSLRRGATTQARNQKVKTADIEMNNRWRKVEAAKSKAASLNIRDHYTEIKLAIKTLIRFSIAL